MQNKIINFLLLIITFKYNKVESIEWSNGADCTTHINLMTALVEDYKRWSNLGATLSCHKELNSVLSTFKDSVDANLIKVVGELNTTLVNTQKNFPSQVNIITAIRSGDFCAAREKLLLNDNLSLETLIPEVYDRNLEYAEKVLLFLNTLHNIDDIINGYRILFDEMVTNSQIFNTVTTTIAYQVMNVFNKTRTKNINMDHLRDLLPESLRHFPWNANLSIHNSLGNEVMFAPIEDIYKFDNERRNSFTHSIDFAATHSQFNFIFSSNGSYFYIKNNHIKEFLFADSNNVAFDIERRRVFSWVASENSPLETAQWNFEAIEGSDLYKIKNIFWNEYLYIDDKNDYKSPANSNCRYILTWRAGACEQTGCKWNILRA